MHATRDSRRARPVVDSNDVASSHVIRSFNVVI
jgi:hypothetical protein